MALPAEQRARKLYEAAQSGNVAVLNELAAEDRGVLLGTSPAGNTCLHIATMCGQQVFEERVIDLAPELLVETNANYETPLIVAAASRRAALASCYLNAALKSLAPAADAADSNAAGSSGSQFKEMVMTADARNDTALHIAIRNYLEDLAVELLRAEPELSEKVNGNSESPLFMAATRGLGSVVAELLRHPSAEVGGPIGNTALHRAVLLNDVDLVTNILTERPELAKSTNEGYEQTPLHYAMKRNKLQMVQLLLAHDPSVAYALNSNEDSPFNVAAFGGHVPVAREIVRCCPDAAYVVGTKKKNALHIAIQEGKAEFVKFVIRTPALHGLLSQCDSKGWSPLHYATQRCDPGIVGTLLANKVGDPAAVTRECKTAMRLLYRMTDSINTPKWNEVFALLSAADGSSVTADVVWSRAESRLTETAEKNIKKLMDSYRKNTTVVAILIATITFAAAFTVPGGYRTDHGAGEGLPVLARRIAFKAFLISDSVAMCSSLAVAFFCILSGLEDVNFLLYYKKSTRALMWVAFCGTAVAFATGLYTMLAPNNLWLAVLICALCSALPLLTYLLGMWPLWKLRLRLGAAFRSDLIERF